MRDNLDAIAHLPMVFMAKIHQVFQLLAFFLQNSINTNKVELELADLDDKHVKTAIKLTTKFFKKMVNHINDNSVPKVPPLQKASLLSKIWEGLRLLRPPS